MVLRRRAPARDNPTPCRSCLRRCTTPSDTLALSPQLRAATASTSCTATPTTTCRSTRRGRCGSTWATSIPISPITSSRAPATGGATHCVDWPPMFEFFARTRIPRPAEVRQVDFVTASPGVSARCHWATHRGPASTERSARSMHAPATRKQRRFDGHDRERRPAGARPAATARRAKRVARRAGRAEAGSKLRLARRHDRLWLRRDGRQVVGVGSRRSPT